MIADNATPCLTPGCALPVHQAADDAEYVEAEYTLMHHGRRIDGEGWSIEALKLDPYPWEVDIALGRGDSLEPAAALALSCAIAELVSAMNGARQ